MIVCPEQDLDDGWVRCSGEYKFDATAGSASVLDLYLVSDDLTHDDMDVDNLSMTFVSGPVTGLVLMDADGDLASYWGEGIEILVTPLGLSYDEVHTHTIESAVSNGDGTTTLTLAAPIGSSAFSDEEPEYAVEVALLSRNIMFESDNSADASKGGHLMVYKTPHVAQTLQGVAFRKFGQQGGWIVCPLYFIPYGYCIWY